MTTHPPDEDDSDFVIRPNSGVNGDGDFDDDFDQTELPPNPGKKT